MSRRAVDSRIDGQPTSRHAPSLHTPLEMPATHPNSSEAWALHEQQVRGGQFVARRHESQAYGNYHITPPGNVRASASSSSSSGGNATTKIYDHQHYHACSQLSSLPETPLAVRGGSNTSRSTSGEEPHRARDDRFGYDGRGRGSDHSHYNFSYGAGPPVAGARKERERNLRDHRVASQSSSWHAWHQSSQTPSHPHPHDPAVRIRGEDSSVRFAVSRSETVAPKESHEQGAGLTSGAHTDLRPSGFPAFSHNNEAEAFSAPTRGDTSRNNNFDAGAGLQHGATRARLDAGHALDRASLSADGWRSPGSEYGKEVGRSAGRGRVGAGKRGHPAFGYEIKAHAQLSANGRREIPCDYDQGSVHSERAQFMRDFDGKYVGPSASAHSRSPNARYDPVHDSRHDLRHDLRHVPRHDPRRDPPQQTGTRRDLMAGSDTSSDAFRRSNGADSWQDVSGTCWGGQLGLAELGSSVSQETSSAERWIDSHGPMTGQAH